LDYDKLSSAVHLARLGLPNPRGRSIHASPNSGYNAPNHHARDRPAAGLNNSPNCDDGRAEYDLARPAKDIARPDSAHGSDKAADIVNGRHYTLHIGRRIAKRMQEVL
jgi:hypothetical protein